MHNVTDYFPRFASVLSVNKEATLRIEAKQAVDRYRTRIAQCQVQGI
jgi:hypothetical protein